MGRTRGWSGRRNNNNKNNNNKPGVVVQPPASPAHRDLHTSFGQTPHSDNGEQITRLRCAKQYAVWGKASKTKTVNETRGEPRQQNKTVNKTTRDSIVQFLKHVKTNVQNKTKVKRKNKTQNKNGPGMALNKVEVAPWI